jgi:hypothetical protein
MENQICSDRQISDSAGYGRKASIARQRKDEATATYYRECFERYRDFEAFRYYRSDKDVHSIAKREMDNAYAEAYREESKRY